MKALQNSPRLYRPGWLESLLLMLKGAIVGTGAILPGISGGVLCAAFGLYEPMRALLAHPVRSFRKYCRIMIPFLAGWLLGFILLAKLVESLFTAASSAAMMLFAGLILGTLPGMLQSCSDDPKEAGRSWTPFAVSAAAACFTVSRWMDRKKAAQDKPARSTEKEVCFSEA